MKLSPVLVFVATYALFLVSGFLFQIDLAYYRELVKPSWTPPGSVIGVVWAVLFACIAASLAILDYRIGVGSLGPWLTAALVANWFFNQAYSYLQFSRKDWFLAGIDAGIIAVTAVVVAVLAWRVSKAASLLFVPYAAWSTFATYLSFLIWSLNR